MSAPAPDNPTLSIILPAFKVQGYLQQCLDSILGQSCTDFEILAIDDCSPDGCGRLFDEYAAADARVRPVHLEHNVGLGEARNIGLDMAQGDYVWFVDSDDWLAEGALEAVAERLRQTDPDVLFVDYARTYWWGKVQRNVLNHLFREPPAPDVFTLAERPNAMQIMMTAWNKIIRRRFLGDLGLRFAPGYYEDLQVTYPILMAAERISLLDRVCYYYRQRRSGAITRTTNDKHFDAFAQYEKIFEFMDTQGHQVDRFRSAMFDRMFWHYFIILGRGDRVSHGRRREFFRRMSEHHTRYRPAQGYAPPGGLLGLKHRLVERDAYRTFSLLRVLHKSQQYLRDWARTARRGLRRVAGRARSQALRGYYRMQLYRPADENLVVYAAYWYRGYAGSPAAIYEKARELAPSLHGVWVVKRSERAKLPHGVDYVLPNTPRYYRLLARAGYLVNNVNFPNEVVKRAGSVFVQTQHGTPLKTMGLDLINYPVGANRMSFKDLMRRVDRWDYSLASNRFSTLVWERAYPCQFTSLETGYPRNDRLYTADAAEVASIREQLGVPPERKAVLYAPTFRDYQRGFVPVLDPARLAGELGDDYVLMLRAHYFYGDNERLSQLRESGAVMDVSDWPSVEDLYLAADMLLTDYSSAMFDYANLDRPIVIHAPDWETYKLTRGVYFDLFAEPPGVVTRSLDELVAAFRSGAVSGEDAARVRDAFRRKFCEFDDGLAAERVVRRVFLDEEMPPVNAGAVPAPAPASLPAESTTGAAATANARRPAALGDAENIPGHVIDSKVV